MATSIDTKKETVESMFKKGAELPFVIPDYQRPYSWEAKKQVQDFFDDIWAFEEKRSLQKDANKSYFIGCIVTNDENSCLEIVDGQQRMITLTLLLRAIYKYLDEATVKTDEHNTLMWLIKPLLWKKKDRVYDINEPLINSRVIGVSDNETYNNILKSGLADKNAKDRYSVNYLHLCNLIEEKAAHNDMYNFFETVLTKVMLTHIEASTQDDALTIFNTLNNRGMSLNDGDIFKAKIYGNIEDKEKEAFIAKWQEMSSFTQEIGIKDGLRDLFYYYMFYVRAINGDNDTTTPGLRNYFLEKMPQYLYDKQLLGKLNVILSLYSVFVCDNDEDMKDKSPWTKNLSIRESLDILLSYPNEFWIYPVVTYYMCHRYKDDFEKHFDTFLHDLIALLVTRFLEKPTVNAIKGDILNLDVDITKSVSPFFNYKIADNDILKNSIIHSSRNMLSMLLKILAYDNKEQNTLLGKWEIEHIFPRKWKDIYIPSLPEEVVDERIEHIGNKIPLEKKLNIKASNGFFAEKKQHYQKSQIKIAKDFGELPIHAWGLDDILERDNIVANKILVILKDWM